MEKVLEYIRLYHMIQEKDRVMAGVSGGADSVCLLFVLMELKKGLDFTLEVVHVEHGIRGGESLKDAEFVERLCKTYSIPFHIYSYDVPKRARQDKLTVEEAARKCRYEAFEDACAKWGGTKIAVAHNENDQAETILWNLVRGSGLKGLAGMKPVNGRIIRPLLAVTRKEIEIYLENLGQDFQTDSTNLEEDYTRNKLRHKVLPLLEDELNGQAVRHISQAGGRLAKAEAFLEKLGEEKAKKAGSVKEGQIWIERRKLLEEEEVVQEYMLRYFLEQMDGGLKDMGAGHLEAVKRLAGAGSGKSLSLPGGRTAKCTGTYLILRQGEEAAEIWEAVNLPIPGEARWGKWKVRASVEPYENQIIPEKKYTKWLDYDTIKNTIQLRSRQTGDYLVTTAQGGRRKLKKYFIDQKILQEERDQILLLADGDHILWVAGYRISEAGKVTEHTKRILKVQIEEEKDGR